MSTHPPSRSYLRQDCTIQSSDLRGDVQVGALASGIWQTVDRPARRQAEDCPHVGQGRARSDVVGAHHIPDDIAAICGTIPIAGRTDGALESVLEQEPG